MVQHKEIITKRVKKTDAVALFSKMGETSSSSKGKQQRKYTNSRDEVAFGGNSSESDEKIRKVNEDMALMAKDIRMMKAKKEKGRYGASDRYDNRYKPRGGLKTKIVTGMVTVTSLQRDMEEAIDGKTTTVQLKDTMKDMITKKG